MKIERKWEEEYNRERKQEEMRKIEIEREEEHTREDKDKKCRQ